MVEPTRIGGTSSEKAHKADQNEGTHKDGDFTGMLRTTHTVDIPAVMDLPVRSMAKVEHPLGCGLKSNQD